jgi:WD40 repeat protein
VWNLETGDELQKLEGHTCPVRGALLIGGEKVLSWSGDCTLRIWSLEKGNELRKFEGHFKGVDGALLLGNGKMLSWSDDKTVRTWDLQTGRMIACIETPMSLHDVGMVNSHHVYGFAGDGRPQIFALE